MVRQLKHYLADLAADPAIRSIVLTGAGRGPNMLIYPGVDHWVLWF